MTVILHGSKKSTQLELLAKKLGNCDTYIGDVTDKEQIEKISKDIYKRYSKVDVLVNCAAEIKATDPLTSNTEDWTRIFNTNVIGTVNTIRSFSKIMLKNKSGLIINFASIRGHAAMASPRVAAYSASKAAILNITSVFAKVLSPHVRVISVSPGFTLTEMSKVWNELSWDQAKSNLLGSPAKPDEIADVVVSLCKIDNLHITGQDILIDGGYSVSNK